MELAIRTLRTLPAGSSVLFPIHHDLWRKLPETVGKFLSKQETVCLKDAVKSWSPLEESWLSIWTGERWVLLTILDDANSCSVCAVRKAGEQVVRQMQLLGIERIAVGSGSLRKEHWMAFQEGVTLGTYEYVKWKGALTQRRKKEQGRTTWKLREVSFLATAQGHDAAHLQVLFDAMALAKALVDAPPSEATPDLLEQSAKAVAKTSKYIKMTVLKGRQLKAASLEGILAVGQGSDHAPRLILLEYAPPKSKGAPILLVGKGVTYDTGGLSLKPAKSMVTMKQDLAGAADLLGVLQAIAATGLRKRIVLAIPVAENAIDALAYKPDDVLHMPNGVTVEISDTDAEGRMILADALAYGAARFKPRMILDVATLTGGSMSAVGEDIAPFLCNEPKLARIITRAAAAVDEPVWELPLHQPYATLLKSSVADIVNHSGKNKATTIEGALFLQHFVPEGTPWCHLDIAGVAFDDDRGMATGRTVRLLWKFLEQEVQSRS